MIYFEWKTDRRARACVTSPILQRESNCHQNTTKPELNSFSNTKRVVTGKAYQTFMLSSLLLPFVFFVFCFLAVEQDQDVIAKTFTTAQATHTHRQRQYAYKGTPKKLYVPFPVLRVGGIMLGCMLAMRCYFHVDHKNGTWTRVLFSGTLL